MRLWSLFSGGKDSVAAIVKAISSGHSVERCISFVPAREDSYMFHIPNIDRAGTVSEAMGIDYASFNVSGEKEVEVEEMEAILRSEMEATPENRRPQGIVSGAIHSSYQRDRIGSMLSRMGLESITPLWHIDPREYMEWLLSEGFSVYIVGVYAEGLDETYLGKLIDREVLDRILLLSDRHGVHPAGEGGEYESLVLDGPGFDHGLELGEYRVEMGRDRGQIFIDSLVRKD